MTMLAASHPDNNKQKTAVNAAAAPGNGPAATGRRGPLTGASRAAWPAPAAPPAALPRGPLAPLDSSLAAGAQHGDMKLKGTIATGCGRQRSSCEGRSGYCRGHRSRRCLVQLQMPRSCSHRGSIAED